MSNLKSVTSSQQLIATRKWTQGMGMMSINAHIDIKHDLKYRPMYSELIYIQLSKSVNSSYDTDNAISLKADVQQLFMMAAGLKELIKYGKSDYTHKGVNGSIIKELCLKAGKSFFINVSSGEGVSFGISFDKYEMVGLYKQIELLAEHVAKKVFEIQSS
jgi:hypothetical protein